MANNDPKLKELKDFIYIYIYVIYQNKKKYIEPEYSLLKNYLNDIESPLQIRQMK